MKANWITPSTPMFNLVEATSLKKAKNRDKDVIYRNSNVIISNLRHLQRFLYSYHPSSFKSNNRVNTTKSFLAINCYSLAIKDWIQPRMRKNCEYHQLFNSFGMT